MNTTPVSHADAIIEDYLRRLDAELRSLPHARRNEIVGDIRAHIAEARSAMPAAGDAEVHNLLDRLGDPATIASEARDRLDANRPPAGPQELAAVLLLGVGNLVIPLLSWCVGALLVWRSRAWPPQAKRAANVAGLVAVLAAVAVVLTPGVAALAPIAVTIAATAFAATQVRRHLPGPALVAATLVTAVVAVPVVFITLPRQASGFVGGDLPGSSPSPCRAFYGTFHVGGGLLGGEVEANVGYCVTGGAIHVDWGPDCPRGLVGTLAVSALCRTVAQPGGALVVEMNVDERAATSLWLRRSDFASWLIRTDGTVQELSGPWPSR